MSLTEIAAETVRAVETGRYIAPSGRTVSIAAEVAASVAGTALHVPGELDRIEVPPGGGPAARVEVTAETTTAAARRLVEAEGAGRVAALNFASARNPGGGFRGEARAQEEDLARRSALVACLERQPAYYEANRACRSPLYTDHLIHSPDVPVFRGEGHEWLERPYPVSVLTCAAPNAREVLRRDAAAGPAIRATLRRRARVVLRAAVAHGHRTIVLGGWGCGVFGNDPADVADAFADALAGLPNAFERVVFAVYERGGDGPNLGAFRGRFNAPA
jgi:uncharacterized protein (TIGR02452 family)